MPYAIRSENTAQTQRSDAPVASRTAACEPSAPTHRTRIPLSRVDLQVSILAALLVILSCSLVFAIHYTLSSRDMITSLQDRTSAIYDYLEQQLDAETFRGINTRTDEGRADYKTLQDLLLRTKASTGVMYLYTAKPLPDGSFIYVVDGLPMDAPDFRHPGDAIEPEIIPAMHTALSSAPVFPCEIKETSWGPIYISYLPIHDGNEVIGVLGIEFDASHQYKTYRLLRIGTPFIILAFCLVAAGISVLLFRRISNPSYRDMSTTDLLTGLKNRNAFDTDLLNLSAKHPENVCLFSIDLDNLKLVNDTMGHSVGDEYIAACVKVLQNLLIPDGVLYRTGGDEFVMVVRGDWNPDRLDVLLHDMEQMLTEKSTQMPFTLSLSLGCSMFDASRDDDLFSTYRRADMQMYEQKRAHKSQPAQK